MRATCFLRVLVGWLIGFVLLAAPAFCNQEPVSNVNSRYTVEAVEISPRAEPRLSSPLKSEILKLVGEKFSQESVDRLCQRIMKELHGYKVVQRITKGTKPENVKVILDVVRARRDQDVFLPKLAYHSKQNFSFGADADLGNDRNRVEVGLGTDNDETLERASGIRGAYFRKAYEGRFRAGFLVESLRAQWNPTVQTALAGQPRGEQTVPGIYRTRLHFQPEVNVEILPGVSIGAGFSLQRFQTQFPAARHERSQALITTLRLERRWEGAHAGKHKLEAGYDLRAAATSFGSDFDYTRHTYEARYTVRGGADSVSAAFRGGTLNGRAPLFERFVLGNTTTLRGYNKYDIAPLGGDRMAHGSVDYRHDWFRVVYDTGVIYSRGGQTKVRHSLAAGLTASHKRDTFSFLVAFPLKDGRAEPIFIVGMNF